MIPSHIIQKQKNTIMSQNMLMSEGEICLQRNYWREGPNILGRQLTNILPYKVSQTNFDFLFLFVAFIPNISIHKCMFYDV